MSDSKDEKQFVMDSTAVLFGLCAMFIIVFGTLAGLQSASPYIVSKFDEVDQYICKQISNKVSFCK